MTDEQLFESLPPGVRDAVSLYRETGSVPRAGRGPGVSPRERRAGEYLKALRWSGSHNVALDRLMPGWRSVRKGRRVSGPPRSLLDLAAFVRGRGRFPTQRRADPIERRLGKVLVMARCGKYRCQEAWLDGNVPGWRGPEG